MAKAVVELTGTSPHGDYQRGDVGYVDGYVRGADGVPCAVVVKTDNSFVLVPINSLYLVPGSV